LKKEKEVNFGDILNKWEKQNAGTGEYDKDSGLPETGETPGKGRNPGERRARLLRKKPDAVIDLHGLKQDEAFIALQTFFTRCMSNEYEKVLIIHGKGNHQGEGVLKDLSRRFIESCPFAGESGYNNAKDGGSGATWVILKGNKNQKSR